MTKLKYIQWCYKNCRGCIQNGFTPENIIENESEIDFPDLIIWYDRLINKSISGETTKTVIKEKVNHLWILLITSLEDFLRWLENIFKTI